MTSLGGLLIVLCIRRNPRSLDDGLIEIAPALDGYTRSNHRDGDLLIQTCLKERVPCPYEYGRSGLTSGVDCEPSIHGDRAVPIQIR